MPNLDGGKGNEALRSSKKAFLLYSPVSILGFSVSIKVADSSITFWLSLALGCLLTLATFVSYQLLSQIEKILVFKKRHTRYIAIGFSATVAGAIRGLIFYEIIEQTDFIQPSSLAVRVLNSTFTAVFWLVFANIVIDGSRRFRAEYQYRLKQMIAMQRIQGGKALSDENASRLAKFEDNLRSSLSSFLGNTDSASVVMLSNVIREQINEELRPLSQRLWLRSIYEYPVVDIQQRMKDALKRIELNYITFIFIMFFLALINNLFIRGITETLFRTFTFLIFTGASLVLANTFRRRKTLLSSAAYLFMVSAPPIIASEMSSRALGYDGDWIAVALITPIPAVVVYVLSLILLMSKDREYVLDLLSTLKLSDSSFSSLNEKSEETALASYLHNSLQSELLALSVQLQNAAEKSDRGESEKLLQQVSSIVNRSIADDFSKFAESPLERLASLESSWRGLLSIEFLVGDEYLQNVSTNLNIVQIVQEVATNVFRYDNATKLVVTATKNDRELTLVLQSNGDGELIKGEGFGSSWFDQIASKVWTIEKNEIGTKIIFEL